MRINHYSSEQFAGVLDHEAKFEPGMNVVLGNNETLYNMCPGLCLVEIKLCTSGHYILLVDEIVVEQIV